MAVIQKTKTDKGEERYRINIRKKGSDHEYKTFLTQEDAELYVFYKERLITNMKNFEVPIEARITLRQIIELKLNTVDTTKEKFRDDFTYSMNMVSPYIDPDVFISKYSYDNWLECAKKVYATPVYRGSKAEHNKREMSQKTLRQLRS